MTPRAPLEAEIAVIGAGAAGLMAAIWAGRTARASNTHARIIALDGARTLGAKILVAGGGRCNVTHHTVEPDDYAGDPRPVLRKVLRAYGVPQTIDFFRELGVTLKREDTGKLFPVTDRARTVLDALLTAAHRAGVSIIHPWRVNDIARTPDGRFLLTREPLPGAPRDQTDAILAQRIILAAGGCALPKSGSDGKGYDLARSLGHTVTPRIFPALVPLTLGDDAAWLKSLSGLSCTATLEVRGSTGKRLIARTGPLLCAHFGISGPVTLDISRHLTHARAEDPGAALIVRWLPDETFESIDRALLSIGRQSPARWLADRLPERLSRALCDRAGVDPSSPASALTRDQRRALARIITETPLPVTGDRGFTHAEVTAGGVPLDEIDPRTMASRHCENLYLIGEILDVDGRIGGFNFQWAWSTGYIAGCAAARGLAPHPHAAPAPRAEPRGHP